MKLKVERDDQFWERAAEPACLSEALSHAQRQVACARARFADDPGGDSPGILGRELLRLARVLALIDDLGGAEELLVEAISIWESLHRPRALFTARMKLAVVWERSGQLMEAEALWDRLDAQAQDPALAMYQDFVFFGRGVFRWRQGECVGAAADLTRSLALREERGRGRLVDETRRALAAAQGR